MGWTPQTLRREASLDDLLDAWQGYAAHHGLQTAPLVSRQFLDDMLRRFPDGGI